MQTTFNVSPPQGMPGMRFDDSMNVEVRSFPAKVACGFGVLLEFTTLTGGQLAVQPVQDATTGGSFLPRLAGISLYSAERQQAYLAAAGGGAGSYAAGEMVPVMRKGRIWVQFDGTGTWPDYNTVNVWHSSTGANPQGVFTMHATQTTVGAEIDNAPPAVILGSDSALAIASYTDGFGNTLSAAVVDCDFV